jgi:hypothetical protein
MAVISLHSISHYFSPFKALILTFQHGISLNFLSENYSHFQRYLKKWGYYGSGETPLNGELTF